jgi:hypothetical protein
MLKNKGDTTCIKLIDFGLSKDYKGQPVMSTPSGSVRYLIEVLINYIALLHRTRGFPAKLYLKDRLVVDGGCAVHHVVRQGSFPWPK